MRKLIFFAVLLLAMPVFAQGQDAPKAELFGGYSYLRADDANDGLDIHGWNASFAANLNKWVGLAADFSGHYGDATLVPGTKADLNMHIFTVGPRFSYRGNDRVTPFAHVLVGAARVDSSYLSRLGKIKNSDSTFALVLGGGLDINANKNLAFRLFQADYVMTRFDGETQNNFRISTGLVLKLGSQ